MKSPRQEHADPAKGLILRFAIAAYCAEPAIPDANGQDIWPQLNRSLMLAKMPRAFPAEATPGASHWRQGVASVFFERLQELLRSGTLVAKAFISRNDLQPVEIPAAWWYDVEFNIEGNWAEAHGTRIRDVLIFPSTAISTPPATAAAQEARQQQSTDGDLSDWFRAREASWPRGKPFPTAKQDRDESPAELSAHLTRDQFHEIRQSSTSEAYRKPGPRKHR